VNVVLIVDDDDRNRKLARDVLGAAGFRTLEAETGARGIALAGEHVPDVVLMDLRLPDMGGAEAARTLRDDGRTARIPIVAMSALPLEERAGWLRAVGFAGWIEKPIHVRGFPDQVSAYCSDGAPG
jgi:two-component system cell cycle response regulator DivK